MVDYSSYSSDKVYDDEKEKIVDEIFTEVKEEPNNEEPTQMLKVCNCERVYVRSSPSKNSKPVTDIANGEDLMVIGESVFDSDDNCWHNVCTEKGAEGYIMSTFTKEID